MLQAVILILTQSVILMDISTELFTFVVKTNDSEQVCVHVCMYVYIYLSLSLYIYIYILYTHMCTNIIYATTVTHILMYVTTVMHRSSGR